jgi:hypothetical protein
MSAPRVLRRLRDRVDDTLGRTPVLIGHSHAKAIFEAAERQGVRLKGYNFWNAPQPALNTERTAFHPEIARTLGRGPVFSAVGGSVHSMMGMVRHPRPFDFVLPSRPDLPMVDGAEIVPFAAIRGAMADAVEEYLQIMRLVVALATGPVFHLEPPPPLADGDRVEADVPWMFFPDLTREVAPAGLRYKCWRLHSELVAAFCAEHGVTLIPAPQEAMDSHGYLKPEHYLDAMHVEASYGALVLAQMKRAL